MINQIFTYHDDVSNHEIGWIVNPFLLSTNQSDHCHMIKLDVEQWWEQQGKRSQMFVDRKHSDNADIRIPVIIATVSDHHVIVDGVHRLTKMHSGIKETAAFLFNKEFSDACRIPDAVATLIFNSQIDCTIQD